MKNRITKSVALSFSIIGLGIIFYLIYSEKEASYLLPLALLCTAIGNFVSAMSRKKQK